MSDILGGTSLFPQLLQRHGWATFSEDGRYRYLLGRTVQDDRRRILYVGQNPSTAGADEDDHTVRKWRGFTKRLGYGSFEVVNLWAFIATDERDLFEVTRVDPARAIGAKNEQFILEAAKRADLVVVCWGAVFGYRAGEVTSLLRREGYALHCFGLTKFGAPKHPLMLSYRTPLEEYGS